MVRMGILEGREGRGVIKVDELIDEYREKMLDRISDALDQYSVILLDRLYDLTRKDTGETAESWEVFHSDPMQIFITNSNEPVATFLSEGTMTHWVEPVLAKALHWIGPDGASWFSKGHFVTGITAHFIEWNALQDTADDLDTLIDAALDDAFEEAFEKK